MQPSAGDALVRLAERVELPVSPTRWAIVHPDLREFIFGLDLILNSLEKLRDTA